MKSWSRRAFALLLVVSVALFLAPLVSLDLSFEE